MTTTSILALAGSAVHLTAYGLYVYYVFKGIVKTNAIGWLIWVVLSFINVASFFAMTGSVWMTLNAITNALCCLTVIGISFRLRSFGRIRHVDYFAIGIAITAGLIYLAFGSPTYVNLYVQVAEVVAAAPIIRGIIECDGFEPIIPWTIWVMGYILTTLTVISGWQGHWPDIVYPVLSLLVHSSVATVIVLCRRHRPANKHLAVT